MPVPSPQDTLPFRRFGIVAGAMIVAVWVGFQISESPFWVMAALGGATYLATSVVNYRWLAFLVIALQPAALILPFLPGRPFLWEVSAMLAWPSLILALLFRRQIFESINFDRREIRALLSLSGYLLVVVTLMLVRGVGFRVLGGGQMGGRFYIQQIALSVVPLLMIMAQPSRRALLWAVAAGWFLSTTYLLSDFALAVGGPRFYPLLQFFELPTDAINFYLDFAINGVRRYQSLWFVGGALIAATCTAFSLRDAFGRRAWMAVPLLAIGFILGLASGHRTALVETVLMTFFLSIFQRFWTPVRTVLIGSAIVLMVGTLYLTAPALPLPLQRSVSFLPGIDVSLQAREDASATIRDRVEVLKLAVNDVSKYWLIGRGFGMERFDQYRGDGDGIYQQYENGLFYNGLLGGLLKTGVPGLLFSLSFVFWISRLALQMVRDIRLKEVWAWTAFDRLGFLVAAQWFSLLVFFYFLHGDASLWVQVFGLPAALIIVCHRETRVSDEAASISAMITSA